MHRIRLVFDPPSPRFLYLDSVNAAIVAGLVDAGAASASVVGSKAVPWTFAVKGFSQLGGLTFVSGLTVSTPDVQLADALRRLNPAAMCAHSSNGDILDFKGAKIEDEARLPHGAVSELAVAFGSPFAIIKPKAGRTKTEFHDDLDGVDLAAALRAGLQRRASRDLDIDFQVDPLTRAVDGRRRLVPTRQAGSRRILIPAFSMPLTVRGRPDDVRFAYFAGLGAKTRGGFGCPVMLR